MKRKIDFQLENKSPADLPEKHVMSPKEIESIEQNENQPKKRQRKQIYVVRDESSQS